MKVDFLGDIAAAVNQPADPILPSLLYGWDKLFEALKLHLNSLRLDTTLSL